MPAVSAPTQSSPKPLSLLVLGQGTDPHSERGVECPGDLPAPSDPDLVARARAAKEALGDRVFVLGHHYQRDEVIEFADTTGDSFKLAKEAAARPDAPYIVFCGVHFMAESADILTSDEQTVVLPDLAAGCSMADMAALHQVQECWDELVEAGVAESTIPVTYMNSSAAIKSFTGRHGGTICTSSNAQTALTWAFDQTGGVDGTGKVLFLPDQHLGRNTWARDLGRDLDDCVVWNPHLPMGGLTPEQIRDARMILWRGHCSVHGRFTVDAVETGAGHQADGQMGGIVHGRQVGKRKGRPLILQRRPGRGVGTAVPYLAAASFTSGAPGTRSMAMRCCMSAATVRKRCNCGPVRAWLLGTSTDSGLRGWLLTRNS